jgi:Fe-Mn family superoxide dismutase
VDLWEHAYYVDYRNKRAEHLEAVVGKLLNWTFAVENFTAMEELAEARV